MERVVIEDYNPAWPAYFEEERAQLAQALTPYALEIEHIGSTSILGLGAKPVIDIAVATGQYPLPDEVIGRMQGIGYEHIGEYGIPRRHYFRRGFNGRYYMHVHVYELTNEEYAKHLLFRDYMRAHPERASAYEQLKRHLAETVGHDREAYTLRKTDFIRETLRMAEEWRERQRQEAEAESE